MIQRPLAILTVSFGWLFASVALAAEAENAKPNIIYIMVDDKCEPTP